MTDPRITQSPGTIARVTGLPLSEILEDLEVWQRRAARGYTPRPDPRDVSYVGHEPCDDPWDRWDAEVER